MAARSNLVGGEDRRRIPPADLRRVGVTEAVQGLAEHDEGGGLAEAMARLAVDGERLPDVMCGAVQLAGGEVDRCERGEGLAFQDPVASMA
jgi:hypothetical protein